MVSAYLLGSHGFSAAIWRLVGLATSTVTFALACFGLWARFDPEAIGYQLVERVSWLPSLRIDYVVGVDGISLMLVLLTTFLVPIVMLASWKQPARSARSSVFFMLMFETCLIGCFVALNLVQFQLLCELALVPMLFSIGVWGGRDRLRAATRFFVFALFGSAAMWVAIAVLAHLNAGQNALLMGEAAHWNLDLVLAAGDESVALLGTNVPLADAPWWQTQAWLLGAFAFAFAIKSALFPLHGWLPEAHAQGPNFGSALLSGALLSLGGYGLLRFALPLFPRAASAADFVALGVGSSVCAIVYGSLVAAVQSDLKRSVAYVSIVQTGFVTLGLFSLDVHGLTGSVVQLVAQGLAIAALFLLVGFLHERRHTREIEAFGGLARVMPVFASCFGVLVMASIGVPALGGFVGQFLILLGSFATQPVAAIVATGGLVLLAAALLRTFRRVVFGGITHDENRGLLDLDCRERCVMFALIVPVLWIGVHPNPILRRVEPAVIELLEHMQRNGAQLRVDEPWAPELVPSAPPAIEPVPVSPAAPEPS